MPTTPHRNPQRVITSTDLSHFSASTPEILSIKHDLGGALFRLAYPADAHPINLDSGRSDLTACLDYLAHGSAPPPLTLPGGRGLIWYIDTPAPRKL